MRTTEFKDTELGPIPKDWEVKRVGECGEIVTGATPPRFDGSNWNGDFAWISARDFTEKYIENTVENVTEKGKRYCRCLPADSVLITCIASIGLNAICKVPCATNQQINAVVCHGDDPEYFYYAMAHSKGRFASLAGQTAVPIINKQQFSDFALAFPPLPEQRRIAAALGDVDKLIENLKKRVEKKKNLKRGAMQELLTGKRRLKGFTGAWVEKRLGDLLDYEQPQRYIVKSSDYCDSGIPVLTPGKSFILGYTTEMDGVCENLPVILFDDFLTISRYITFPFKVKSSAVKMLRLRNANDSMYFIQAAMESLGYVPGDHQRHWIGIFSKLTILMPECVEQRAIAAVLSDMDAEIANLEHKLKKMTLLKQGMMQDLLTGKVRLV